MAVSNTTNQVIYTGDDSSTVFPYAFKIFDSTELVVQKYTIADGTTVDLAETTDYSVSGAGDDDGGNVTLNSSLLNEFKLIITRVLPLTQEIDYVENDPFPAETHEEGLDRAVMRDQQLQEQIDRAIKVQAGSGMDADTLIETLVDASADAVAAAAAADASADAAAASEATALGVANSIVRTVILKVIGDSDSLLTGDGQLFFVVPAVLNGLNLTSIAGHVFAASSSGNPTVQLRNVTDSQDMLSTRLTIDSGESDSKDAAAPAVIDTAHDDVSTADVLAIDVDVAGTGTQGLELRLTFA